MDEQQIENEFIKNVYSSRDLRLCDPKWLEIWPKLKEQFGMDNGGLCLEISCTYRSPKAQNDLYQLGRTKDGEIVTYFDGYEKLSAHNIFPSKAIDVYIHLAGKIATLWNEKAFEPLGALAKKFNLNWGGSWKKYQDCPHLEIPIKAL